MSKEIINYLNKLNKNQKYIDNIEKDRLDISQKEEIIYEHIYPDLKKTNLNKELLQDIELINGNYNHYESSVLYKIDNTNTTLGHLHLKYLLSNTICQIDKLKDRQTVIEYFIKNVDIYQQIKIKLETLKLYENDILWLWKKNNKETDYYLNSVYFKSNFLSSLNYSSYFINLFTYYKIFISPSLSIIYPVIAILIPYFIIRFFFKIPISFQNYYKLIYSSLGITSNFLPFSNNSYMYQLTKFISSLLWFLMYLNTTYYSVDNAIKTNQIINIIHNKMNNIVKFINITKEIQEIVKYILPVSNLQINNNSILSNFNHLVFEEQKIFNNKGIILTTYYKLKQQTNILIPYLQYISQLDSYMSISQLYLTHKDINRYTLSNYNVSKDKPYINIVKVWHPCLDNDKVIKNDIILNDNAHKRNMIITGPNAGGKSTLIKSILISIILSQTITIAPCKNIEFTPFYNIQSYLHIPDCKGKESLFEAEINRTYQYIQYLKTLEKNNLFSFIVMDEIFNSTNPKEGISGGYAICSKIGEFKNNISIITTHFKYLTKLEKKTKYYDNYKMTIIDKNNKIIYNYKLKRGVSNQCIALKLLEKKGFDKEIISKANKVYQRIKNNV